jgi:pimeloyl-ACP methyl ester carboxylesterase
VGPSIGQAVAGLNAVTKRLRVRRLLLVLVMGGDVLMLAAAAAWPSLASDPTRVASLVLAGLVLALAGSHEASRRQGESSFEDLIDQLQRRTREGADTGDPTGEEAKAALRSFAIAASLPLIPGKFGPMVYAFLAVLITGGVVTLLR